MQESALLNCVCFMCLSKVNEKAVKHSCNTTFCAGCSLKLKFMKFCVGCCTKMEDQEDFTLPTQDQQVQIQQGLRQLDLFLSNGQQPANKDEKKEVKAPAEFFAQRENKPITNQLNPVPNNWKPVMVVPANPPNQQQNLFANQFAMPAPIAAPVFGN